MPDPAVASPRSSSSSSGVKEALAGEAVGPLPPESGLDVKSDRNAERHVHSLVDLVGAIEVELGVAMGQADSVRQACVRVGELLRVAPPEERSQTAERLLPLLALRCNRPTQVLFEFLVAQVEQGNLETSIVPRLLDAADPELRERAADLLLRLSDQGTLEPTQALLLELAYRLDREDGPLRGQACLKAIGRLLASLASASSGRGSPHPPTDSGSCPPEVAAGSDGERNALERWLSCPIPPLRRLAARILDLHGRPTRSMIERVLGPAHTFLGPYLDYTGAGHLDLVTLTPEDAPEPPAVPSLRTAEQIVGRPLLQRVLGQLGWRRVCWGVYAERQVAVQVEGSFPYLVAPEEVALLEQCGAVQKRFDRFLIMATGSLGEGESLAVDQQVQRFRRYNATHAKLLAEILEVAPLTAAKVHRLLDRMAVVVTDFVALFQGHTADADAVVTVFEQLRSSVLAGLEGEGNCIQSPPTTRLVQMFEDPRTLSEVQTLHGLKRYLHQQGLTLAFRLFRSGVANRTVDLLVASTERVLRVFQNIRYVEFEPFPLGGRALPTLPGGEALPAARGRSGTSASLPLAVALVVEAYGRQLLFESSIVLPAAEILAYGNEVQIFLHFVNHPAFLRLDLSPPLRGGMIDLEYFGVSQYELERHPNLGLPGIRRLFSELDFDTSQAGVRLHFRYDKERAFDFGDLMSAARSLFHVAPYLMDLDWILAALDYPDEAREIVASAWARFARAWGVLPLDLLLTKDRRRVLQGTAADPAGPREIAWDGTGSYCDRFSEASTVDLLPRLQSAMRRLGLYDLGNWEEAEGKAVGQRVLERTVLFPLREAIERGEARVFEGTIVPVLPTLFVRDHEAARLAALLDQRGSELEQASDLALGLAPLERELRFRETGTVQGYPVERAVIRLRSGRLGVFVLRDATGIARLALAAEGAVLYHYRENAGAEWKPGPTLNRAELEALLRSGNAHVGDLYLPEGAVSSHLLRSLRRDGDRVAGPACLTHTRSEPGAATLAIETLSTLFGLPYAQSPLRPQPGDRMLPGVAAAPGRATGVARFLSSTSRGDGHTRPDLVTDAVLVAPALRPEDMLLLRHVAAIVSTGGGILSHAGLVALELQKPALIVQGRWRRGDDGRVELVYRRPEFREEGIRVGAFAVTLRRGLHDQEETLNEGDLVVVDADRSCLIVLGQDREALVARRELQALEAATTGLERTRDPAEALTLRGRLLRAVHQLERLFGRIESPTLARYSIRELLSPPSAPERSPATAERHRLLGCLLSNPRCKKAARQAARQQLRALSVHNDAMLALALGSIPIAKNLFEVLFLRTRVLQIRAEFAEVSSLLQRWQIGREARAVGSDVDGVTRCRLLDLHNEFVARLHQRHDPWKLRQVLRSLTRLDSVLGAPGAEVRGATRLARRAVEQAEAGVRSKLGSRRVLKPAEYGLELEPLIGAKASNLGEISRVLGANSVPAWFAVSDCAFREVLLRSQTTGPQGRSLQEAINGVLHQAELDPGRKAELIRELWQTVELGTSLEAEVLQAYRALAGPDGERAPYVAVRSSTFEEDGENRAWAGQFDSFMFVRGERSLLDHLVLAWAGLWNEKALCQRDLLPESPRIGGGVIVQRMVRARVSGVLLTASAARGQPHEMVINAGLGLGEGVVSGVVGVDQVLVEKRFDPEREPLRCKYEVGDKRERVVFDADSGHGTRREATPYHQRFRAALEYVEVAELVDAALLLESSYQMPLDLEFAFEGPHLRILQARPVPVFHMALRETLERYPLRTEPEPREENRP